MNSYDKNRTVYESDDIALCRLTDIEVDGSYPSWFVDEDVNQFNSHFYIPASKAEIEKFVESLSNDRTKLVFAIYSKVGGCHVGNISLQSIDHQHSKAELAFLLGEKEYWGKGIGYSAAKILMEHAKLHMNIRRLYLGCIADNTAMNKLAIKLGFNHEGTLIEDIFCKGKYRDVNLYGIIL